MELFEDGVYYGIRPRGGDTSVKVSIIDDGMPPNNSMLNDIYNPAQDDFYDPAQDLLMQSAVYDLM